MRLARYGDPGSERPVAIDAGGVARDLSEIVSDIRGATLTRSGLAILRQVDLSLLPVVPSEARIGPAVGQVGKFICVGLNFHDHAAESGLPVPEMPVLFMKATTAICGPNDDVRIPRGSKKTDCEVELGVVIGDIAQDVNKAEARDHIAGYLVVNDVSEREFQMEHGGQWVKGKSCDTFGPIGPWLLTADEMKDPQALGMWLEVNGRRFQVGNTANMVFDVFDLVSHISRYMTLMPGDIISTGTPAGVGLGQRPPVYLKAVDVVELGIDELGRQRQTMVQA